MQSHITVFKKCENEKFNKNGERDRGFIHHTRRMSSKILHTLGFFIPVFFILLFTPPPNIFLIPPRFGF